MDLYAVRESGGKFLHLFNIPTSNDTYMINRLMMQ